MACVGDVIYASPLAVLGSIGVIQQLPNVYERLEREGIEALTVTAGKYKRTLTPFKKPNDEDFAKTEADLENVYGPDTRAHPSAGVRQLPDLMGVGLGCYQAPSWAGSVGARAKRPNPRASPVSSLWVAKGL